MLFFADGKKTLQVLAVQDPDSAKAGFAVAVDAGFPRSTPLRMLLQAGNELPTLVVKSGVTNRGVARVIGGHAGLAFKLSDVLLVQAASRGARTRSGECKRGLIPTAMTSRASLTSASTCCS